MRAKSFVAFENLFTTNEVKNYMNDQSTGNTGTRDETFNLASILYHSLKSAETIDKYIENGGQGSNELEQFFRETKEENSRRADPAKNFWHNISVKVRMRRQQVKYSVISNRAKLF